MPDWTLEYDGSTQPFAAWGLAHPVLKLANFAPSVLTAEKAGAAYDAAAPFANGAAGIARYGSTVVFRGTFGPETRSGEGATESIGVQLRDAWHDLTRLFYIGSTGLVKLFDGETPASIASLLETVVDYAQAAGVDIQFGTATNLGFAPISMETRDVTCADVLRMLRRWCPDTNHWLDYTTSPPTIHFVRRADASAVSVALEETSDAIQCRPLHDNVASAVVLRYVKTDNTGGSKEKVITDAYPPGSTTGTLGAIVATFDLRAPSVESQELATTNINYSSRNWWSRFYPDIDPGNADLVEGENFAFDDQSRKVQDEDGQWVNDSYDLVNEVTDGAVREWMDGEARQVLVEATLKDFTLNDVYYPEMKLRTTVLATDLAGGTFTRETHPGDAVPVGIAAQYYAAVSVLHWQGSVAFTAAEIALPLIHPAKVLNLTGGLASSRGWTTMRAVIQSVTADLETGNVRLAFGPPQHLGPQDLIELARMRGTAREHVDPARFEGEAIGGGVKRTANHNTMPAAPTRPEASPLQGFKVSDGWQVKPGLVNSTMVCSSTGVRLDNDPPPTGSLGDGFAWLQIKALVTFTEGYLTAADLLCELDAEDENYEPVKVMSGEEVPANEPGETTSGEAHVWTWNIQLFQLADGVPSNNLFGSSMTYVIEDTSTAETPNCILRGVRA